MAIAAGIAKTIALVLALAGPVSAQVEDGPSLDALFAALADPELADPDQTVADIRNRMAQSGSATLDYLLRRGRDALRTGDPRAAVEHFTALTDHAPDFVEGWHGRAQALFLAGQTGAAIADLRRVLALEPRHFEAWAGLGAILIQIDRRRAAYQAWERALALNPHLDEIREAVERLDIEVNGRKT
jgi:Flp pilus assembly protein TadD